MHKNAGAKGGVGRGYTRNGLVKKGVEARTLCTKDIASMVSEIRTSGVCLSWASAGMTRHRSTDQTIPTWDGDVPPKGDSPKLIATTTVAIAKMFAMTGYQEYRIEPKYYPQLPFGSPISRADSTASLNHTNEVYQKKSECKVNFMLNASLIPNKPFLSGNHLKSG